MISYKPISTIKNIFIASIIFSIVLSIMTTITSTIQIFLVKEETSFLFFVGIFFILDIGFTLAMLVIELIAIHRIAFNDKIIHNGIAHITPGWAVGYYFIPIASLFMPYKSYKYFISQMTGEENKKIALYNSLGTYWTLKIISAVFGMLSRKYDNALFILVSSTIQLFFLFISLSFFKKY